MDLRRNVLQEDDILCELYVDTCSDVPTTSSRKQLQSSTGPLTPQFPHPFFLTLWVGTVWNLFSRPGILVTTVPKHRIQGGYSKFGPCVNILYRNLGHSRWLFKIWPVYEYFIQKFKSVYSPKQELLLEGAMIPWRGCLKFRIYNPGKITKYAVLLRMVRRYQVISPTWRWTQLGERSWRTQCYHF